MIKPLVLGAVILSAVLGKSEHRLILRDISISQAMLALKMAAGIDVPLKVFGRLGSANAVVTSRYIIAKAERFSILGDPVKWVRITYNRKTREYVVVAEALGGLIELAGVVPE